ncbi:extracellular solute-binding protein [Chitinispirillales bacterium ANBcel5]|uniref:extracellular solute-binding protein n=1 Tax=Cellulosispirillum alkaliphilum TaxID=3039283 RepID=UPI002A5424F4|nr:extracellular solute-binding protein [Chitinispirillales bacterium ANBcel5]
MRSKYLSITLFVFLLLFTAHSVQGQTLRLWLMPNGTYPERTIGRYLDIFEQENPHLKVEVDILDWGVAWSRLVEMAENKEGPDVVQLGTTWVPHFARAGALLDLKDKLDDFGGRESFQQTAWSTTHRYARDESVALPWFLDTRPLLANRKYFDEQGFSADQFSTWESLKESLVEFKEAGVTRSGNRVWPISHSGIGDWNVVHNFAPWIWSAGGSFIEAKGNQFFSNIRNPATVEGIRKYISFALEGLVDPDDLQSNMIAVESKLSESRAFLSVWTSFIFLQEHDDSDLSQLDQDGVLPMVMPEGPQGQYSFLGGSNLSVTSFSENPEEAQQLMQFLLRDTIVARYCSDIGTISGRASTTQKHYVRNSDHYRTLLENVKVGRSYPNTPEWGDVEIALNSGLENIWRLVQGVFGDFNEEDFLQEISDLDKAVNEALGISQDEAQRLYESVYGPDGAGAQQRVQDEDSAQFGFMFLILGVFLAAGIVIVITESKKKK